MVLLAIDFQSLTTTLESVRDEMISGSLDNFIGIARLIGGLGAHFYIAYRVWGSLARAEPIDVFPLLKPFALGLLIINFSWVTGFLDVVISPIKAATIAMVSSGYDEVTKSRENGNRVREAKLREEGKAYVVDDAVYQEKMDKLDFWQSEFWSVQKEKAMYDLQKTAEDLLHTIL